MRKLHFKEGDKVIYKTENKLPVNKTAIIMRVYSHMKYPYLLEDEVGRAIGYTAEENLRPFNGLQRAKEILENS